jgi:hypothetical protein
LIAQVTQSGTSESFVQSALHKLFFRERNVIKLTAIAIFLSLIPFAAAEDQLGTVKASSVSCPATGLRATACYALEITCPDIPDYTAYVKILTPSRRSVGAIIFSTGGDGNEIYESYAYGTVTVQNVVAAGYEAVELTFGAPFSDGPGWQHDVAGMGIRAASCRYATVVKWVYDTTIGVPLCATGQSGGAQLIGEGLAHYGLGNYLRFAEPTSGPPFGQEVYACINDVQPEVEYCSGALVGMGVGLQNAIDFVNPAYPGPWCSESMEDHSTEHEAQFRQDSVTSPDAVLSYPNTKIRFLFGGQDTSSAIRQGLNYQSQIVQPSGYACVEDAPHTIPDALDGAREIASDLIAECR